MRRIRILIITFIIGIIFSYPISGEVTRLSKKASELEIGMSRKMVINLLGNASWAVIPSDKGDSGINIFITPKISSNINPLDN